MGTLIHDLRYALRVGQARPGVTLVTVLTLALAIGANTAIFSVVNATLLRPLPFPDPDRLTMVWMDNRLQQIREDITSYPNYLDWRRGNRSFETMAAFRDAAFALSGPGEPERLDGALTTASFFDVMRVEPVLGRTYTEAEETPGRDQVVVLSYGLWQRAFGGRPDLLGQAIALSGLPHEIIGVMPTTFAMPAGAALWKPLAPDERMREARGAFWLPVIGRLRPGVTVEQAQTEMTALAARLERDYPAANTGFGIYLNPLHRQIVGDVRPALLLLFSAVGLVLLIACVSLAGLSVARAAARGHELAVRAALGAGRGRIVRQLLTESLVSATIGGGLGLLVAIWGVDLFVAVYPRDLPGAEGIRVDATVLAFTALVAVTVGLLFGLLPAVQASRPTLGGVLNERRAPLFGGRHRTRSVLVVAEIALALVLLVGAGLMLRSFWKLQDVNPGFDPDSALLVRLSLPTLQYPEASDVRAFYAALLDRVQTLPGIRTVAATTVTFEPGLLNSTTLSYEGRAPSPPGERIEIPIDVVTPGIFDTLEVPLLAGRPLNDSDGADGPPVAIISDTMARVIWPGEDPIGRGFKFGDPDDDMPWIRVVGVVADVRRAGPTTRIRPQVYLPFAQASRRTMTLVVRTHGEPGRLLPSIRGEVRRLDADLPIFGVTTLRDRVDRAVAQPRFAAFLLVAFAGVALLLAALGVYGVVWSVVTQRTTEIGVRLALGADRRDIFALVLGRGLALALVGLALGGAGAVVSSRLLASLLFDVSPTDPPTLAAVMLTIVVVALLASYLPARRAMDVDPAAVLRAG